MTDDQVNVHSRKTGNSMNNDIEIWHAVPSASGYEVSNLGNARSIKRTILTTNGQTRTYQGRNLIPTPHSKGYWAVTLGKKRIGILLHRLILEAFVGPCPPGMESRHLDGCKTNDRLDNLQWGTPLENGADRIRHSTAAKAGAKLNPEKVRHIRQLRRSGFSQKEAGSTYGVNQAAVSDIEIGQTWKDVL